MIILIDKIKKIINNPFFLLVKNGRYRKIESFLARKNVYLSHSQIFYSFLDGNLLPRIYSIYHKLYPAKKDYLIAQYALYFVFNDVGSQYLSRYDIRFLQPNPKNPIFVIDLSDCWDKVIQNNTEISLTKYKEQIEKAYFALDIPSLQTE